MKIQRGTSAKNKLWPNELGTNKQLSKHITEPVEPVKTEQNRTNMSHRAPCPGLWLVSDCLCSCNNLFCFFSLSSSILTEEEKKKKVVRLPVQRSVETGLAIEFKARFTRQPSRDPDAEDPKPGAYESLLFLLFLSCILCLVKLYSYSTHLKQGFS